MTSPNPVAITQTSENFITSPMEPLLEKPQDITTLKADDVARMAITSAPEKGILYFVMSRQKHERQTQLELLRTTNQDTLPIYDRTWRFEDGDKVEDDLLLSLQFLQLTRRQLHTAQLFHGASSASLLAFTNYNNHEGALVPSGELRKRKKVAFCGAYDAGQFEINTDKLSTIYGGFFHTTVIFATSPGWTPFIGREILNQLIDGLKKMLQDTPYEQTLLTFIEKDECEHDITWFKQFPQHFIMGLFHIELQRKRIREWEKLDDIEKKLVAEPFPVVYGITSTRTEDFFKARSAVHNEIGLLNGALPKEIKVIFVVPSKVDFVKDLLAKNGHDNIFVESMVASASFLRYNELPEAMFQ